MALPRSTTLQLLGRVAILFVAVALWVVCIILLMEITRTLVDTLRFIVELGSMA